MRKSKNSANLLRQLDKDIVRTQRDIGDLQDYLAQLQTVRSEIAGQVITKARTSAPKPVDTRTEALTEILRHASGPVTVDDVMKELANAGRPDEKRLIHSTLSYLARKDVAERVGKGQWVAKAA